MSKPVQILLKCGAGIAVAFLASFLTCIPVGVGKVGFGIVVVFLAAILFDIPTAISAAVGAALGEWAAGAQIEFLAFAVLAYALAGSVTAAFYRRKGKASSRKSAVLSAALASLVSLLPWFGGTLLVSADIQVALVLTAVQAAAEAVGLLILAFVLPRSVFEEGNDG